MNDSQHKQYRQFQPVVLQTHADTMAAEMVRIQCDVMVQQAIWYQEKQQLQHANQLLLQALIQADAVNIKAEARLHELAQKSQSDALTKTPNRNIMLDRIQQAISTGKRRNKLFAVLFIDLDNFKPVNDQLGHAIGDQVLLQVAERLTAAIRDSDTLSRYGGDEFLLLLSEVTHRDDVCIISDKINRILAAPYQIGTHSLDLSASIGMAVFPQDGTDVASLINHADAAMYRAKRQGGGTCCG
ncbi:GGDEF domain-containing protein [Chromatiaceae bacterium AAb-1]|nr:GGDEF domain-containing protein [Chromatiaceae bacterium AAb-1]